MGAAVVIESGWEILENTDFIINRYRTTTMALDYFGDSVINSISDILAMTAGFLLAARLPLWASLGLVIAIEPWFLHTTDEIYIDADGWTIKSKDGSRGAHMEHTIAITDDGAIVLTARD